MVKFYLIAASSCFWASENLMTFFSVIFEDGVLTTPTVCYFPCSEKRWLLRAWKLILLLKSVPRHMQSVPKKHGVSFDLYQDLNVYVKYLKLSCQFCFTFHSWQGAATSRHARLELPRGTFRDSSTEIYTKLKKGLGAVCLGTALVIISIKTMAIVEGWGIVVTLWSVKIREDN